MGIWPFIAGLGVGLIVGFLITARGTANFIRDKVKAGRIEVDGTAYRIVKRGDE